MKSFTPAVVGSLRCGCSGLVVILVITGLATARANSPDGSDPFFKVLQIDGHEATGRIVSFGDSRLTIATKDGKKEVLLFDQLVKLTRESTVAGPVGESSQAVLLGDGDRLMRASIGVATDASFEIRSELLGKLEVPLDCVLGVVLS